MALKIMANISGWIAFPVIIGLFLGKWLDKKYGTEPWLFLITIAVCFTVSIFGLATMALQEFKKIEEEARLKKETTRDDASKSVPDDFASKNKSS